MHLKKILLLSLVLISSKIYALETVNHVNLSHYLGKWYEIARFEAWFEKGCTNVTAEYAILNNGKIEVTNSCFLENKHGKFKQSKGRASVVDKNSNAKLKVSFLPNFLNWFDGIFSGDYWIIKLDPQYQVAMVGEPSKNYLWILSRTPTIDPQIYQEYVDAAKQMGFDITKFHKTVQD